MVGLVCFHDKVSLSHLLELMSFSYSLELHESNLYMYFVGVSVENVAYSPPSRSLFLRESCHQALAAARLRCRTRTWECYFFGALFL